MSSRICGFTTEWAEPASPFCGGLRHGIDRGDAFPSSTINEGAFTSSAEADAQLWARSALLSLSWRSERPKRISQWTGDLKLVERFESLSPEFSSAEGPARRYKAARNGWGSGQSPNTAVWVTRPLSSHHRWSW